MNLHGFNQKSVQTTMWKSTAFHSLFGYMKHQNEKAFLAELLKSGDLHDFPLPFHRFRICVQAFVSIHWKLRGNSDLICVVGIVILAYLFWLLTTFQIWKWHQYLHFLFLFYTILLLNSDLPLRLELEILNSVSISNLIFSFFDGVNFNFYFLWLHEEKWNICYFNK